jgi:hypothetical protein
MFVASSTWKGMDFYRASNSQSWERLWKALYVEDVRNQASVSKIPETFV